MQEYVIMSIRITNTKRIATTVKCMIAYGSTRSSKIQEVMKNSSFVKVIKFNQYSSIDEINKWLEKKYYR